MDDIAEEDVERCRRGDLRGLEAVFRAYGDRVYRLCLHLLGQPADAEDAAQEVFLRIHRKARTFTGRSRFSTWIHRLTVNHCRNRRRGDRRLPRPLDVADELRLPPCPRPSPLQAAERDDALVALLARLDHDARAILVLREVEGLSYREIADVLRVPEGTVMSRLSRARDKLARALAGPGPRPHAALPHSDHLLDTQLLQQRPT